MNHFKTILAAATIAVGAGAADAATYSYVGSWEVYNPLAPIWSEAPPDGPLAYTAQEAAALLFGGTAADYVISTVSNLVADIDFQGWYDVIGFGGAIHAQDYNSKYLGQFYGPTSGYFDGDNSDNAASAFVRDNFVTGANYAFKVSAVPLPAAGWMLIAGIGGLVAARRRKAA